MIPTGRTAEFFQIMSQIIICLNGEGEHGDETCISKKLNITLGTCVKSLN